MEFHMPEFTIDLEKNKQDPTHLLSPQMKAVIDFQAEHSKDAFATDCSWDELRAKYVEERRYWNEGGPVAYKTLETTVEGPIGPVSVRLYYPDDKPLHRAVVFIHGGGFTVGNNDTHDRMMRCVMGESGCVVIGVDYHLAPEVKFPIPLYECAAVARYFHENGAEYGLLTDRMGLCGDSGGANLSLATNLYLRDAFGGNDYIGALALYYGSFGLKDSAAKRLYGTILDGMRASDLKYYQNCYLESDEDIPNPYYSTLNNDLTFGLPATYLCCGDLDPLLDDSVVLQKILESHGVRTQLDVVQGALHAYMHYGRMMDDAVACLAHSGQFLKEELNR